MPVDGGDVGEKDGVAGAWLGNKGTAGAVRDLDVEDIGSFAFVEDEEDLRQVAVACGGFEIDDLVDARFEESEMLVGHWSVLSLKGFGPGVSSRHCEQTAGPSTAPLAMRPQEAPLRMLKLYVDSSVLSLKLET